MNEKFEGLQALSPDKLRESLDSILEELLDKKKTDSIALDQSCLETLEKIKVEDLALSLLLQRVKTKVKSLLRSDAKMPEAKKVVKKPMDFFNQDLLKKTENYEDEIDEVNEFMIDEFIASIENVRLLRSNALYRCNQIAEKEIPYAVTVYSNYPSMIEALESQQDILTQWIKMMDQSQTAFESEINALKSVRKSSITRDELLALQDRLNQIKKKYSLTIPPILAVLNLSFSDRKRLADRVKLNEKQLLGIPSLQTELTRLINDLSLKTDLSEKQFDALITQIDKIQTIDEAVSHEHLLRDALRVANQNKLELQGKPIDEEDIDEKIQSLIDRLANKKDLEHTINQLESVLSNYELPNDEDDFDDDEYDKPQKTFERKCRTFIRAIRVVQTDSEPDFLEQINLFIKNVKPDLKLKTPVVMIEKRGKIDPGRVDILGTLLKSKMTIEPRPFPPASLDESFESPMALSERTDIYEDESEIRRESPQDTFHDDESEEGEEDIDLSALRSVQTSNEPYPEDKSYLGETDEESDPHVMSLSDYEESEPIARPISPALVKNVSTEKGQQLFLELQAVTDQSGFMPVLWRYADLLGLTKRQVPAIFWPEGIIKNKSVAEIFASIINTILDTHPELAEFFPTKIPELSKNIAALNQAKELYSRKLASVSAAINELNLQQKRMYSLAISAPEKSLLESLYLGECDKIRVKHDNAQHKFTRIQARATHLKGSLNTAYEIDEQVLQYKSMLQQLNEIDVDYESPKTLLSEVNQLVISRDSAVIKFNHILSRLRQLNESIKPVADTMDSYEIDSLGYKLYSLDVESLNQQLNALIRNIGPVWERMEQNEDDFEALTLRDTEIEFGELNTRYQSIFKELESYERDHEFILKRLIPKELSKGTLSELFSHANIAQLNLTIFEKNLRKLKTQCSLICRMRDSCSTDTIAYQLYAKEAFLLESHLLRDEHLLNDLTRRFNSILDNQAMLLDRKLPDVISDSDIKSLVVQYKFITESIGENAEYETLIQIDKTIFDAFEAEKERAVNALREVVVLFDELAFRINELETKYPKGTVGYAYYAKQVQLLKERQDDVQDKLELINEDFNLIEHDLGLLLNGVLPDSIHGEEIEQLTARYSKLLEPISTAKKIIESDTPFVSTSENGKKIEKAQQLISDVKHKIELVDALSSGLGDGIDLKRASDAASIKIDRLIRELEVKEQSLNALVKKISGITTESGISYYFTPRSDETLLKMISDFEDSQIDFLSEGKPDPISYLPMLKANLLSKNKTYSELKSIKEEMDRGNLTWFQTQRGVTPAKVNQQINEIESAYTTYLNEKLAMVRLEHDVRVCQKQIGCYEVFCIEKNRAIEQIDGAEVAMMNAESEFDAMLNQPETSRIDISSIEKNCNQAAMWSTICEKACSIASDAKVGKLNPKTALRVVQEELAGSFVEELVREGQYRGPTTALPGRGLAVCAGDNAVRFKGYDLAKKDFVQAVSVVQSSLDPTHELGKIVIKHYGDNRLVDETEYPKTASLSPADKLDWEKNKEIAAIKMAFDLLANYDPKKDIDIGRMNSDKEQCARIYAAVFYLSSKAGMNIRQSNVHVYAYGFEKPVSLSLFIRAKLPCNVSYLKPDSSELGNYIASLKALQSSKHRKDEIGKSKDPITPIESGEVIRLKKD